MSFSKLNHTMHVPDVKLRLQLAFLIFVSITFILLVFQPFGTFNFQDANKYGKLLGYSIIGFMVFAITPSILAKKLYSREVKTDNWSLVKEISILTPSFFLANILSALYDYFVISPSMNLTVLLWQFQIWGFLILIFPIFGYLYFLHNSSRKLKRQRQNGFDQLLTISGNGKADVITIAINETLYFKASDNYVEVFIQKPSGIEKHIIRAKLMSVYEQVKEAGFVQVHRSYLVNIFLRPELIMENGNYEICFSGLETKIPVSRTYLKEFRKKLAEVPL